MTYSPVRVTSTATQRSSLFLPGLTSEVIGAALRAAVSYASGRGMERVDVDAAQLGGKTLGCGDLRVKDAGVRRFWVQTGTALPGSHRLGIFFEELNTL